MTWETTLSLLKQQQKDVSNIEDKLKLQAQIDTINNSLEKNIERSEPLFNFSDSANSDGGDEFERESDEE